MNYPNEPYEYEPMQENAFAKEPVAVTEETQQFFAASEPVFQHEPQPAAVKEKKKAASRGFVAVMLIFSILLSAAVGGFAGYMAGSMNHKENENPLVLYGGEEAMSVADVAALCSPSVVAITTESKTSGQFMQQYVSKGAGSGVILTDDGYIVTNYHVIQGATNITVNTTDGKEYTAKVVSSVIDLDISVLKIEATGLTPAVMGDSDGLVVGQAAIVIGNPLGKLAGTVSNGIISALDREITLDGQPMNLLQTNAAVNPGNSGGGLFDATGKLVGIVNAKSGGAEIEGIGFAIPINDVKEVTEQIMEKGYADGKIKLGITMLNLTTPELAERYDVDVTGVYISAVEPGSLAESYGLKSGDRLVALNGEEITSGHQVTEHMATVKPNDTVSLTIVRGGKIAVVDIKVLI